MIWLQWPVHSRFPHQNASRYRISNIYIVSYRHSAILYAAKGTKIHFEYKTNNNKYQLLLTDGKISRSEPMNSQSRNSPLHLIIR